MHLCSTKGVPKFGRAGRNVNRLIYCYHTMQMFLEYSGDPLRPSSPAGQHKYFCGWVGSTDQQRGGKRPRPAAEFSGETPSQFVDVREEHPKN